MKGHRVNLVSRRDCHSASSSSTPSVTRKIRSRRDLRVIHLAQVRPDVLSRHVLRMQGDDPLVEPRSAESGPCARSSPPSAVVDRHSPYHNDPFDAHVGTGSVSEPKPENAMRVAVVCLAVSVLVTIAWP